MSADEDEEVVKFSGAFMITAIYWLKSGGVTLALPAAAEDAFSFSISFMMIASFFSMSDTWSLFVFEVVEDELSFPMSLMTCASSFSMSDSWSEVELVVVEDESTFPSSCIIEVSSLSMLDSVEEELSLESVSSVDVDDVDAKLATACMMAASAFSIFSSSFFMEASLLDEVWLLFSREAIISVNDVSPVDPELLVDDVELVLLTELEQRLEILFMLYVICFPS